MRMRLPQLEEELWQIITGKAPLRTREGMVVTDQDGTPVMDYAARPRDRAYAAKLYFEYSMARILPEELPTERASGAPPAPPLPSSVSKRRPRSSTPRCMSLGDDRKRRR